MPKVLARPIVVLEVLCIVNPLQTMVLMSVKCTQVNSNIGYQVADVEDRSLVKVAHFLGKWDIHPTTCLNPVEILIQKSYFGLRSIKV